MSGGGEYIAMAWVLSLLAWLAMFAHAWLWRRRESRKPAAETPEPRTAHRFLDQAPGEARYGGADGSGC